MAERMSGDDGDEFPNFTCVAVPSPVPLIVTIVPGEPLVGEKLVMLCAHAKVPTPSQTSRRWKPRSVERERSTAQTESDLFPTGKPAGGLR